MFFDDDDDDLLSETDKLHVFFRKAMQLCPCGSDLSIQLSDLRLH